MSQLDVFIMGQAYKLACKEGEEAQLQQAVTYLDEKMCAIRDTGKVRGNDRIAVMAALSMAAELLSTKSANGPLGELSMAQVRQVIADMHDKLDGALTPQENLF
jgi:cell division protein ZapA